MFATCAAVAMVCGASLALGQAAIAFCGARRWSWLAPAVGLALLCALSWATVRLPGGGTTTALVLLVLLAGALAYLWPRPKGGRGAQPIASSPPLGAARDALLTGLPVGLLALAAASLPFLAAGHFGILGTGFNPDMSQHLLAADRLGDDIAGDLRRQGYPLGLHAVVVALNAGLGIGLVQGFSGLTIAMAVLAALTAQAAFTDRPPSHRIPLALLVGLPYLVASYYAQGAVKETAQALLVLAFLLALRESERGWAHLTLRYAPAATIAIGTVYIYSFPGLIWLIGIVLIWTFLRWPLSSSPPAGGADMDSPCRVRQGVSMAATGPAGHHPSRVSEGAPMAATGPAGRSSPDLRAASLALLLFAICTLPELGRMLDFQRFETFDPNGPGLGNLFGQLSPFTALGIWPSGDFRVAPGDGAVPALAFHLGAAFAAALLIVGLHRAWLRGERTILAAVLTVVGVYAAARLGGTPYTAAKALAIAAPVLTLAILTPAPPAFRAIKGSMRSRIARNAGGGVALVAYVGLAGACSLLALANAPVGPSAYSPALVELRPAIAAGSTLVLAPDELLEEEEGHAYLVWELRGGRVCVEPQSAAGSRPPAGIEFVLAPGGAGDAPYPRLRFARRAGEFTLWHRPGAVGGPSPCPLIAERQARAGAD